MIGNLVSEDLQGPLDPGASCYGGSGRAAQVGIIEVSKSIGGCAHLASHPTFFPGHDGFVCSQTSKHGADRIAVSDDHSIHATNFPRLGCDSHAACGPDECKRRFGARAGVLEGRGPTGLSQGPMGQEGPSPSCLAVTKIAGGNPRTGRPLASTMPVWRARASPPSTTRTRYLVPLRMPLG